MTIEECYIQLHGDYADAKKRLMTDRLVEKFMLKFPADPTMQELVSAVAAGDIATSFRAVHTLKGVAANLAFTELQKAASELTEQLRDQKNQADPALYEKVQAAYQNTVSVIESYRNEQNA